MEVRHRRPNDPLLGAFYGGMRELGWIDGKNFIVERRYSEGKNERFPDLVAELVKENVDLLVTSGTSATAAARSVTKTIPIVFVLVGDPVGSGLVASLARPGGNVTGQGGLSPGLHAKMVELLKEVMPKASRIAAFVNSTFALHAIYLSEIEPISRTLGVALKLIEVRAADDLDGAFASIAREKTEALLILGQPLMYMLRARVARLALDHRVPAIILWSEAVEAGVLMSYGDRNLDHMRRLPHYVDRILKGATG